MVSTAKAERKSSTSTSEKEKGIDERQRLLKKIFTPSRPIQTQELFSGRVEQLEECLKIPQQSGMHGILHGDRGVGKSSIANIVHLVTNVGMMPGIEQTRAIKIECTSSHTFKDLIKHIFDEIEVEKVESIPKPGSMRIGFNNDVGPTAQKVKLSTLLTKSTSYNPRDIYKILDQLGREYVIILDEFDRLDHGKFFLSDFTELLKIISDNGLGIHFLVVGVGDDVQSIIGNHKSIVRNLTQIKLREMADAEIDELVTKGIKALKMRMPNEIISQVVRFVCGYPHYAHLLCYHACFNALSQRRIEIEAADMAFAVTKSISVAHESLRGSYQLATIANKKNIYKEVLRACGEAILDEYNTFQPKDIEKPLSEILKRPVKANQFGGHLQKLCTEARGSILVARGEKGRVRYKFRDPLMRAFVRLNASSGA